MSFHHEAGVPRLLHESLPGEVTHDVRRLVANAPEDDADEVADVLADAGIDVPARVLAEIDRVLDASAYRRAGEAFAEVTRLLDGTAVGAALRRVLLDDKTPLRETALAAGLSATAVSAAEARLRRNLDRFAQEQGGWLTGFANGLKGRRTDDDHHRPQSALRAADPSHPPGGMVAGSGDSPGIPNRSPRPAGDPGPPGQTPDG